MKNLTHQGYKVNKSQPLILKQTGRRPEFEGLRGGRCGVQTVGQSVHVKYTKSCRSLNVIFKNERKFKD